MPDFSFHKSTPTSMLIFLSLKDLTISVNGDVLGEAGTFIGAREGRNTQSLFLLEFLY
jgi:hypothetical protein